MFKKKEKPRENPLFQGNDAANRIISLGNLDKKALSLIEELPIDDPLRKQYASLPRKGCSKDIKKFERLEKELQNLIFILEKEVETLKYHQVMK